MSESKLPRLALFPMGLLAVVMAWALAANVLGPRYDAQSARIAEASQLVVKARDSASQEDWLQVRQYAGQAVALNPSHVLAHLILGVAYFNTNTLDQAEAEFRRVIPLSAEDRNSAAWAHNNLGVVMQRRGRFAEASQEYQTAIDLDSSNGQARANLAEIKRFAQ